MSRTSRSARVLALCALLIACKQEPFGNMPVRQRGVAAPVELQPQAAREEPKPAPFSPQLVALRVDETPKAEEPAPSTETLTLSAADAMPVHSDKPPRNMQQELETMIGSPVDCIAPKPASSAPPQLRLALSASVMPSGAVGRGEVVASSELSKSELDCLRSRLEGLHFAEPIDNAPVTVSGAITLNYGS